MPLYNQRTETTATTTQMIATWQSFYTLHIIRMASLWTDTESAKKAFEIWSFVFAQQKKPQTSTYQGHRGRKRKTAF